MKILIASALFPPDIAEPAPYVKELVTRLQSEHEVTVLTYGSLPEKVKGVTIQSVEKKLLGLFRLAIFTTKLLSLGSQHEVIIINNAPSTELPLILTSPFLKQKLNLLISDRKIHYAGWRRTLHERAVGLVRQTLSIDLPNPKPEIHPFKNASQQAITEYEQSWESHLKTLQTKLRSV